MLKGYIEAFFKKYIWTKVEWFQQKKARARIKNHNFSILSSNCIGGVMYNLLGYRFNSPTINTYINNPDFCKFCSDLDYYLSQDLVFFDDENFNYPVAYLGSEEKRIKIQFVHYKTQNEAIEKWEERKRRIFKNNLYIILNDGNGLSADDIKLLNKCICKRVIIFTSEKKPEIVSSFQIKSLKKDKDAVFVQLKRDFFSGLRPWQKEFDFVAWLNDESAYRIR